MKLQPLFAKTLGFTFFFILVLGCQKHKKTDVKAVYRAINDKDTSVLSITFYKDHFVGQFERMYYNIGKDSGNVRGQYYGDTLKGDYHYYSYGRSMKRIPIALLKKNNQLYWGEGVIGTYMNLPCFVKDVPINYNNSNLVFKKIK